MINETAEAISEEEVPDDVFIEETEEETTEEE